MTDPIIATYLTIFTESSDKQTWSFTTTNGTKCETDVPPEKRTLDNIPKYATGKRKVKFQEWLCLKKPDKYKHLPKSSNTSWGMSPSGEFFGWSHRAVGGFKVGDVVDADTCGNIHPDKEWTIKSGEDACRQAIAFSDDVS